MNDERRILIFEPVPTDAEFIELQIRKAGIPITVKRVGTKEMFEKVMEEFPPDLVIANPAVPRCDVLAFVRQGRENASTTQWIIVSGSGSEDLAVQSMKAGAVDYVAKKNIARLGAAVKAALENPSTAPSSPPDAEEPTSLPTLTAESSLFRRVIESSRDLIAVLDLDGKRVYNSPSYQDLLEEPDTLEGTSSFVDIHPDDREKVKSVFQATVATGIGERLEYRLIDRDGNIRYIESQGSVIGDEDGKPEYVVIISRDISGRRQGGEIIRLMQEEIARLRGDEFFPGLVRTLAGSLGVRYALVSECVDSRRVRVRALAYWASGGLAPTFEYDVKQTTCEQVLQEGRTMYFPSGVQQLFPEEVALSAMNADSYLGTPLLDSGGTPIGHLFIIDDKPLANPELATSVLIVTASRAASELEHRHARQRSGEGEARYRALLEGMTDGVIVTDKDDVITYVNRKMGELAGYAPEEMIGKLASTLLVPDEEHRNLNLRNERRQRGLSERYETSLKHKDASRFNAVVSAAPHRGPGGDIIGTLALISAQEQVAARQSSAEAAGDAGLLEKAQDAAFVCELDDRILFWNSAATQLYGWLASEVRGKTSTELLHTEAIHRLGGAAHTALLEGYWTGELRQRRKDGSTVVVDSRWSLIRDGDGRPRSFLVLCTDITGKKELEVYELRARRMAGISTLASAIAADLNLILTPVTLAVPSLVEKASDESSRQAVALISANAQRGIEMANQVLALAENDGGGGGRIDVRDFLARLSRGLTDSFPDSIIIESVLPPSLWAIPGIVPQLQQVLNNVCTNAREAMADGGVLRLSAENVLVDPQTVAGFPHALPGKYVLITVGDTGAGISPEIIGNVFEPFFTTKTVGRTTGLGLSTASAIMRNHNGFMTIFSEPVRGTIVKIYLPVGNQAEGEEGVEQYLGGGERIIIAQQQASLRDIMRKILEVHGYEAIVAADGAEAVAIYRRHKKEISAVIIDLDMPYMDGSATIKVLQQTNPALPIIVTGDGAQNLEVAAVLPKPFSTRTLLRALKTAVDSRISRTG